MVFSIGSMSPSGAARTIGSLVLVQRIAHSRPSGPIRRRLEATRSTRASPLLKWVQGRGSASAAAAALAAAARARSAQSPAMMTSGRPWASRTSCASRSGHGVSCAWVQCTATRPGSVPTARARSARQRS